MSDRLKGNNICSMQTVLRTGKAEVLLVLLRLGRYPIIHTDLDLLKSFIVEEIELVNSHALAESSISAHFHLRVRNVITHLCRPRTRVVSSGYTETTDSADKNQQDPSRPCPDHHIQISFRKNGFFLSSAF
jgi:hypothetical protein